MILPSWIIPSVFVLSLAVIANLHCLHGSFVFDDSEAVVNNPDVSGLGPWIDILKDDFWGTPLKKESSHLSFRPITTAIFRVLWKSVGKQAVYFRLLNLLIHGAVSVYLYRTLLVGLDLPYDPLRAYGTQVALIASSMFAIHPIHVESLCSAVGLADVLSALFFLCALNAYLGWTRNHESRALPTKIFTYSALAMFCKEPGVTVLGVCGAYELLIICDIIPHHAFTKHKGFVNSFKKSSLIRFAFCACSGILLTVLRCLCVRLRVPTFTPMDNPAAFLPSPILRAINYQYIYSINLLLLFYPHWLCFDWSMGCIPAITSALDPRLLALLAFWICIATIVRACSREVPLRRWLCLGASLLVIPFLPSSNLLLSVGFVIAERNLYLPSMGFCLLVAIPMVEVYRRMRKHKQVFKFAVIVLLFLLAGRSLRRSRDWVEDTTLFNSGLSVCPLNAKVHYNIAKVSTNEAAAIESYRRALSLNPEYDQAMNNLANLFKEKGAILEAKRLLERAIEIRPTFAAAWMNLGIVETSLQNFSRAEQCYRSAILHRNRYPHCYFNLGNMYIEMKAFEMALDAYRQAVTQAPDHLLSWNNMAIMLDSLGKLDEAERVAREALKYLPEAGSLHFHLGNTLGKKEKYEESEKHFLKAIDISPEEPTYRSNLGVLYHRWGRLEQAREQYLKALDLDPSLASIKDNLRKLERGRRRRR